MCSNERDRGVPAAAVPARGSGDSRWRGGPAPGAAAAPGDPQVVNAVRSDPEPHVWRQAAELTPLTGAGTFAVAALCAHRVPLWMPLAGTFAVWVVVAVAA